MDLKEFGLYFAELREKSGFSSQRQLAMTSGVSNGTIARIEGGTQKVTPETLKKLSPYLKGVSYGELMEVAGYIDEDTNVSVAGKDISLSPEEYKLFHELKKYPALFNDLASDPEKKIKELIKLYKMKKMLLEEDDEEFGNGFGDIED